MRILVTYADGRTALHEVKSIHEREGFRCHYLALDDADEFDEVVDETKILREEDVLKIEVFGW